MAALMTIIMHDDTEIVLARQHADDGSPLPAQVDCVQVWGQPPPYTAAFVPISLPYYAAGDAARMRAAAERYLPHWQLELRDVFVAAAVTHDDASALFKRWGW